MIAVANPQLDRARAFQRRNPKRKRLTFTVSIDAFHPRGLGWGDGTGVQFQLDSNLSATPFKFYIDRLDLTKW